MKFFSFYAFPKNEISQSYAFIFLFPVLKYYMREVKYASTH